TLIPEPHGTLEVLDAGCGTGLCAPVLRPFARHLTGIDVSERMLDLARQRGLYDRLIRAELTEALAERENCFDLIAVADVLCYLGDLKPVIAALARALRPDGALAFTAEQAPDPNTAYRLAAHGRYLHGESALRALLGAEGLTVAGLSVANLRNEDGQPSPNLVMLATKSTGHS
ncbi:MAG: methyltransferase domain-containing protein, partial [Rhodospirillaceae bacterium]